MSVPSAFFHGSTFSLLCFCAKIMLFPCYCYSLKSEIYNGHNSSIVLFAQGCFSYPGSLVVPLQILGFFFPISVNSVMGILIEITLTLGFKAPFCISQVCLFFFKSVYMTSIAFIDLRVLNCPCVPGIKSTWLVVGNLFGICWIQVASILLKTFKFMFIRVAGL